jgi:hypothetical protein
MLRLRFGQEARHAGPAISASSRMAQCNLCVRPSSTLGAPGSCSGEGRKTKETRVTFRKQTPRACVICVNPLSASDTSRATLHAFVLWPFCAVNDRRARHSRTPHTLPVVPEQVSTTKHSNRSLLCFSEYIYAVSCLSSDMRPLLFDGTLLFKSDNNSQ